MKFVKLPLGSRCVFRDEQDVIGLLLQSQLFVAYGWPARVGQSGLLHTFSLLLRTCILNTEYLGQCIGCYDLAQRSFPPCKCTLCVVHLHGLYSVSLCLHFHYYYCFCYYYIRTDHFLFTGLTSKIALSHSPLTAARAVPQILLTSFKPPGYTSPCQTYVRYPRCGLQCAWAVANPSYKCPKTLECSVVHFPKMNVSGQV